MELNNPRDLLSLSRGDTIPKRNLYDLVQFSKVKGSKYWSGEENRIGNTPQQGINWVGQLPNLEAVIIKTRHGSYQDDGWSEEGTSYRYSFKARNGKISYSETANDVLIKQAQYSYPILLFTEQKETWKFEGGFFVSEIQDKYVVLKRGVTNLNRPHTALEDILFQEGDKKYVTHLLAERCKDVVDALKKNKTWLCEICEEDFLNKYGVRYIEAHHKIPLANYANKHFVSASDLALLCPNCHKAVHILMKPGLDYVTVKEKLKANLFREN